MKGDDSLFRWDCLPKEFFEVFLSGRTVQCFSLQTYIMGRFATGFLDEKDLAQLNERNLVGRLIRARSGSLLLVYNVLAEGMNRKVFENKLEYFKKGIDAVDYYIGCLLS